MRKEGETMGEWIKENKGQEIKNKKKVVSLCLSVTQQPNCCQDCLILGVFR
jgi:hypothetical protein